MIRHSQVNNEIAMRWSVATPITNLLDNLETTFVAAFHMPPGADYLLRIIRRVLLKLDVPQVKESVARECISFIVSEICGLDTNQCAMLCLDIMRIVREDNSARCVELFPQLMASIPDKVEVVLLGDEVEEERRMPATEFKDDIMKKLCQIRWSPSLCNGLLLTLYDVHVSDAHLDVVISKVTRSLHNFELQDLPSVIFQFIAFSSKGHRKQIISSIINHFGEMNSKLQSPTNSIDKPVFRSVESTIIYHINYAVKQEQELGREFIKVVKNDRAMLNSFSVCVMMSLSRNSRFEQSVVETLKTHVINDLKVINQSASPECKPITEVSILDAMKQFEYGREELWSGIIPLGVTLVDTGKPATATPENQTFQLFEKVASFGHKIVLDAFLASDSTRAEILEHVFSRFLTSTGNLNQFLRLFQEIVKRKPTTLLEHISKIKDTLNYISVLPYQSSIGLIKSLGAVLVKSSSLLDYTLLVLKKAMYSREADARLIGAGGYLYILQLDIPSQSVSVSSSSQSRAPRIDGIHSEILGNLRRSLSLQAPVRELFYDGIVDVFESQPPIRNHIIDILCEQFLSIYESNTSLCPLPINPKAIDTSVDPPKVVEPVAHLINSIQRCLCIANRDEWDSSYLQGLKEIMDEFVERMISAPLDDFELTRTTNYNPTQVDGRVNLLTATLLSGVYECCVEYLLLYKPSRCEEAARLFEIQQQLISFMGDKGEKKGGKKQYNMRLLSYSSCSSLLMLAVDSTSADRSFFTSKPALKSDIFERCYKQSLLLFQDVDKLLDDMPMISFCNRTGVLLYKEFTRDLQLPEGMTDLTFSLSALKTIEQIVKYMHLHQSQARLVDFILKLLGESGIPSQVIAIDKISKLLTILEQQLEKILVMGSDGHAQILVNIILTLLSHISNDASARHFKVFDGICQKSSVSSNSLAASLVRLHTRLSTQTEVFVETQYSSCIQHNLKLINDEAPPVPAVNFVIVNQDNVHEIANVILSSMMKQMTAIEDLTTTLKSSLAKEGSTSDERSVPEKIEASIYPWLLNIARTYNTFVETAHEKPTCEVILQSLVEFYRILGIVARLHIAPPRNPGKRFRDLVAFTGEALTQNCYAFTTYMEKLVRTSNSSIAKEARLMPSLIFMIEQYETLLIKISKKFKINLIRKFKRSTIHDFRIQEDQFAKADKNDSDDEENKGKKKGKKRAKQAPEQSE